jgi:hypothetical protein
MDEQTKQGTAHDVEEGERSVKQELDRMNALLGKVETDIAELRNELCQSEIIVAATRLRVLNEQAAQEGIGRLRSALHDLRQAGVIDDRANRISKDLPREMLEDAPDAV